MDLKHVLLAIVIVAVAASLAVYPRLGIKGQMPGSTTTYQSPSTTLLAPTSSVSSSRYGQQFCLDASSNATAMAYAVENGITCFRADIGLNQGEMDFVSNVTRAGGSYLGILDYVTLGAQTSRYGCASNCNWTLATWNATVEQALADYPEVHQWEIYNEPLIRQFMGGYENGSALNYYNMIRSASEIIKSRDPNATVVCFGGAQTFPFGAVQNEYPFYAQGWSYGAFKYCDAISLHSYILPYYGLNQSLSGNATVAEELNFTVNLYENLTGKPIWITETGLPSNGNQTLGISFTEQEQNTFLRQDMEFYSSYPFVSKVYWFHLEGAVARGLDYGLLNSTTLQPKESWHSFLYFVSNSTSHMPAQG